MEIYLKIALTQFKKALFCSYFPLNLQKKTGPYEVPLRTGGLALSAKEPLQRGSRGRTTAFRRLFGVKSLGRLLFAARPSDRFFAVFGRAKKYAPTVANVILAFY